MQTNSSPKRELPRWIQEYIAQEEREDGDESLLESLRPDVEKFNSKDGIRSSWKLRHRESRVNLNVLKIFAMVFLIPGLAGLVFSAMVSTDYRENLPRIPSPTEQRTTPRNVHGVVIYQTTKEDKRLSVMEYVSVSVFLVGLLLGIFYLEKWSMSRQLEIEANLLEEFEV